MRKTVLLLIAALMLFFTAFAQKSVEEEQPKSFQLKKPYLARPDRLLIDDTDLYCSYYIDRNDPGDITIMSSQETNNLKSELCEDDRIYLNKGQKDGVNEGDVFLIIGKGPKISSRVTGDTLGYVYEKKSLAEVVCIYENMALARLYRCCDGVNVGDFAIPFEEKDRFFSVTIDYRRCYIEPNPDTIGRVAYAHIRQKYSREFSSTFQYFTADLGNDVLASGDLVLLYKILKKNLPPLVFGLGVVIAPSPGNSTVKVLETSLPVEIGDYLIPAPKDEVERAKARLKESEKVPSLKDPRKDTAPGETTPVDANPNLLSVDLLFDIDERVVNTSHTEAFNKIKDFIGSNTGYSVVLRGYACSIGGLDYNLKLSQDRVTSVRDYLTKELGVPETAIQTSYYGEADPRHDNSTEEERRKNRTVNIEVTLK